MAVYRRILLSRQDEFKKAVQSALSVGALPDIEAYKRPKQGEVTPDLMPYYNAKYLYFVKQREDVSRLFDAGLIDEIKEAITAFEPMYKFLLFVLETSVSEKGSDNE